MSAPVPERKNQKMSSNIDTSNEHLVCVTDVGPDPRFSIKMPVHGVTRDRALTLAAWLVALADVDDEFGDYLRAVGNT